MNQIELHPAFQNRAVRAYGEAHGIATQAWSPLAQGRILGDPVVTAIAASVGRTPAQVVLRWHVQHGRIVFPKSASPARMRENFELFDFALAAGRHGPDRRARPRRGRAVRPASRHRQLTAAAAPYGCAMADDDTRAGGVLRDLLAGHPRNWGRWGDDDEVGSLNFLGEPEVLRGVAAVRTGRVFTLGSRLARPDGDPVWPGRPSGRRYAVQDKSTYDEGHAQTRGR